MKKVRIGKDIHITWGVKVKINGSYVNLSECDLTVLLSDEYGTSRVLAHRCNDDEDTIEMDFPGKDQKRLSEYRLTAWLNYGKTGQAAVDKADVFELVALSTNEGGTDDDTIETATITLESDELDVLQGLSAYGSWLAEGHIGTEEDFLEWLREPASNVAGQATQFLAQAQTALGSVNTALTQVQGALNDATHAKQSFDEAKAQIESNELARQNAEATRESQESERQAAEAIRKGNESGRAESENRRTTNEYSRTTAENTRIYNENKRKDAEYQRQQEWESLKRQVQAIIDQSSNP